MCCPTLRDSNLALYKVRNGFHHDPLLFLGGDGCLTTTSRGIDAQVKQQRIFGQDITTYAQGS